MADFKNVNDLEEVTTIDANDYISIIDVSDTTMSLSGTNKKVSGSNFYKQDSIGLETPNTGIVGNIVFNNNDKFENAILVSDAEGNLIPRRFYIRQNDIGNPGEYGFGCGICPEDLLPVNFERFSDYYVTSSTNYGNYIHTPSSSVIVWIPKFYYRINHESNPTHSQYAPNDIDIKSIYDFEDTASANAEGYALHRAFIDGGVEQPGFFIDKYSCSKVAYGTGYIGASIKNGVPIGFDEAFSCITELTASNSVRQAYIVIDCAKARDGVDGQVNPTSNWHCASTFQYSALALLSLAHGQASTNTSTCAWYDPVYNYPKGNNNNTLGDIDDPTVTFQHDGYLDYNTALTGSGVPFAKTTHNGQDCGVADLNGNMNNCLIGVSSLGYSRTISNITLANPCVLTINDTTNLENHSLCTTLSIVGTTELDSKVFEYTVIDSTHISLNVDSTSFTPYTSGGILYIGSYYVAKESTSMKTFTSGNTLETDHWGPTGISNLMELLNIQFRTDYPNNATTKFGSSTNQVFSNAISGEEYILTGCGFPLSTGIDATGTDLFGADNFQLTKLVDKFFLVGCGPVNRSNNSGIFYRNFNGASAGGGTFYTYRTAYYL